MPNFKKSPAGGPSTMKMYGKGKNPIMMTAAQETLPEVLKAGIRAKEAEESNSPMDMYGKKGTMAYKYKSDAQRKAVHASKAERK